MAENDTVIEFRKVTKTYKLYKNERDRLLSVFSKRISCQKKDAVKDLSFRVQRGEAVALFGRNGAGKSTILKMITGVTFPTKGKVTVRGRVSALLELTAGFDREMTGRENIYLKGQLMGIDDEKIKKIEPVIEEFADIGAYIDQPVKTYSSGMRARLGFAINVNAEPEILIVDEALSVGDAKFKRKCIKKVNEVMEKDGITLLFVTHSVTVAQEFCTRGLVMKSGSLVYDSDIKSAVKKYEEMVK